MSDTKIYSVNADIANHAHIDASSYEEMYARSINDPDGFWGEHGKRLDWIKPYSQIRDISYDVNDLHIKFGLENCSYVCCLYQV